MVISGLILETRASPPTCKRVLQLHVSHHWWLQSCCSVLKPQRVLQLHVSHHCSSCGWLHSCCSALKPQRVLQLHVSHQTVVPRGAIVALAAGERLLAGVRHHMPAHVADVAEALAALGAHVRGGFGRDRRQGQNSAVYCVASRRHKQIAGGKAAHDLGQGNALYYIEFSPRLVLLTPALL